MFLIVIFFIALIFVFLPQYLILYWIKFYEWLLDLSIKKEKYINYFFITLGFFLFILNIYLYNQNFKSVDRVGLFILLFISVSLIFFHSYFTRSISEYCKLILRYYKGNEQRTIVVTRMWGVICIAVIAFLKFFQ